MTTYNETELATRVLRDLGLVGADEAPSASDLAWAMETCAAEIDLLASINLPIWNGSDMAIPQGYLTILSRRIGLAVAPSFGLLSMNEAQQAMREAERYLTLLASPRGGRPLLSRTDDATPRGSARFRFSTG